MNKGKKWIGLLVTCIVLLIACPMAVLANPATTVSIPDASADPSTTVMVPINITDVADLGAADIWLYYNKNVVIVDSVANGDLGVITFSIDNTAGVTKMNWFSATGQTGDFIFAYVTLHAVGDPGDTSALDLVVKELVDTSAVPISHDVDDGLFTVTGVAPPPPPPGGVGGTAYLPDKLASAEGYQPHQVLSDEHCIADSDVAIHADVALHKPSYGEYTIVNTVKDRLGISVNQALNREVKDAGFAYASHSEQGDVSKDKVTGLSRC